jgi:hypothetical protein
MYIQKDFIWPNMTKRKSPKALWLDEPYSPAPPRTNISLDNALAIGRSATSDNNVTLVTLILATENVGKTELLKRLAMDYCEGHACRIVKVISVPADSGEGEQPYDMAGPRGMIGRGRSAMDIAGEIEGVPLVGVIENFIERVMDQEVIREAYDYGMIGFYDGLTKVWTHAVTKGVKVDLDYLTEAMNAGFADREQQSGILTYGQVLAAHYDVDPGDWHKAVCGVSRFELLWNASQCLRLERII